MATSTHPTPDPFLVHRSARAHPQPLPTGELLVAAPPTVSWPGPATAAWLQYLVPMLGGAGSLAFLFAVPGPRHPLLVVAVAGTAVASLGLGVVLRLHERRTARKARRRERSRYLAHLAQVAAAADQLATAQLAAADHLHPDPPRLWTLVCRAERLWERRPTDDDFLTVRVGRGPVPLHAPVRLDAAGGPLVERDATLLDAAEALVRRAAWLPEAPVTVPLRRLGVLALTGPRGRVRALARALLCQLAALHAPDDLRILAGFPLAALLAWSGSSGCRTPATRRQARVGCRAACSPRPRRNWPPCSTARSVPASPPPPTGRDRPRRTWWPCWSPTRPATEPPSRPWTSCSTARRPPASP
jgi:DNA segregation ATPase FtsK/SpoIIIE, S-DNA-T family